MSSQLLLVCLFSFSYIASAGTHDSLSVIESRVTQIESRLQFIQECCEAASRGVSDFDALGLKEVPGKCCDLEAWMRSNSQRCDMLEAKIMTSESDMLGIKAAIIPLKTGLHDSVAKAAKMLDDFQTSKSFATECMMKSESIDSRMREIEALVARSSHQNDSLLFNLEKEISERLQRLEAEQRAAVETMKVSLRSFCTQSKAAPVLNAVVVAAQNMVVGARVDSLVKSLKMDALKAWYLQSFAARTKKTAIRTLVRVLKNALRSGLRRWHHHVSLQSLKANLFSELSVACREMMSPIMEGINDRILTLDEEIRCQSEQLNSFSSKVPEALLTAREAQEKISDLGQMLVFERSSQYGDISERVRSSEQEVQSIHQKMNGICDRLSRSEDQAAISNLRTVTLEQSHDRYQHLFADIIMLWNSMKKFEMTKIDKSAVEELFDRNAKEHKREMARVRDLYESASKDSGSRVVEHVTAPLKPALQIDPDTKDHSGAVRPRSAQTFSTNLAATSMEIGIPQPSDLDSLRDRKSSVSQGFKSSRSNPALRQPRGTRLFVESSDMQARGKRIPPAGGWGYNRCLPSK